MTRDSRQPGTRRPDTRRPDERPSTLTARSRLTLALLAAATLVVMTTETLPVGLLAQMAAGLRVSEGRLGLLVTAYGAVVVVAAVPLSILIARFPPRRSMLVVLGVFVVSIAVTAASGTLGTALVARLVGGAAHAVFYSCSFTMATSVVPERMRGRAVAIGGSGNALALALGVPAATAVGAWLGWRVPFAGAAGILVVIVAALMPAYRPVPESAAPPISSWRPLVRGIRSRPLARVAITIVIVMGAHFLTYTYISPILTDAGVPTGLVSVVLVAYGIAGVIGLVVAGRVADTHPALMLKATVALTLVSLALLWLLRASAPGAFAATAVWGIAFGAAPVLWQLMAVHAAPGAASIGPAVVNSAFNVGISLGALGGGALLAVVTPGDLALPSLGLVAVALVLVARRRWLPQDPGR
jgi:predicted MFS family arabinose efflux permease